MNKEINNTQTHTETEDIREDIMAKKTQKKKKRNRKSSKESTESPKTTIKKFFKEECKKAPSASTPLSAKKRSPPSASKPQPKRRNKQESESEDSEVNSSDNEDSLSEEEYNKKEQISLSPELVLLKDVLRAEIKSELDRSIDTKLEPLQTSLNSLVAKSTQSPISAPSSQLREENLSLKIQCLKAERENNALKLRVRQLERTLKENNLVFTGLRENPWETCSTTYEKIHRVISNTMTGTNKEKLEKAKKIGIINATRIGKYKQDRGRPICVKFSCHLDVQYIMDNKKKLGEGIFVDYEYDQETIKNRKMLFPILKAARNTEGYKGMCKLERDILTLKGKRYTVRNIGELPTELSGFHVSSKSDDDTYAFFGELNPFSNFHPSPFKLNNITYNTSEHYIQSEKAKYYGDSNLEIAILSCDTALEAKKMGHQIIKPKDMIEWKEVAKEICAPGIKEKFHQNTNLRLLLLSTNNQTLVEASHDSIWGTGIPLRDEKCLEKCEWKNTGILGEILMDLRSSYQTSGTDISDQNTPHPCEQLSMTVQNTAVTDMTNQNLP